MRVALLVFLLLTAPARGESVADLGPEVPPPPALPLRNIVGRSGFFERIPPRAERTPEERARKIAELREAYARPTSQWPAPIVDEGVQWKELGLLPRLTPPAENPMTKEKVLLGRILFFDPRVSGTGEMACASCHDPDLGWADGRTVSFGLHRLALKRNSPSILNAAYAATLFWDGRAGSLEDQAEQVLQNPQEMGGSEELIQERLGAIPEYRAAFEKAFGDGTITLARTAQALASFERTLVGGRSRFDVFLRGKSAALSDEALLGLDLFRREARCINCHNGPLLTDGQFHDVGLSYYGRKFQDRGRYEITQVAEDVGRFRTPSLRNVTATEPVMHNGLFEIPNALALYNAGMPNLTPKPDQKNDPLFPARKSRLLKPLGLNRQDLGDLEAFLKSLEEPRTRLAVPALPGLGAKESADSDAPEPATTP